MDAKFSLSGKNLFITGASSGIGRACAVDFSESGAKALLSGRDCGRLSETMASTQNSEMFPANLGLDTDIKKLADALPALDGAVFCAGIDKRSLVKFLPDSDISEVLNTNLVSTLRLVRALTKSKKINKGASLVFIASIAGIIGDAGHSVYAISKAATICLARELAVELASRKIRVNSVSPGLVKTPMTHDFINGDADALAADSKKYLLGHGEASQIACAAHFLLSDAADWITGTNIVVDGGYSCWK